MFSIVYKGFGWNCKDPLGALRSLDRVAPHTAVLLQACEQLTAPDEIYGLQLGNGLASQASLRRHEGDWLPAPSSLTWDAGQVDVQGQAWYRPGALYGTSSTTWTWAEPYGNSGWGELRSYSRPLLSGQAIGL